MEHIKSHEHAKQINKGIDVLNSDSGAQRVFVVNGKVTKSDGTHMTSFDVPGAQVEALESVTVISTYNVSTDEQTFIICRK